MEADTIEALDYQPHEPMSNSIKSQVTSGLTRQFDGGSKVLLHTWLKDTTLIYRERFM